MSFNDSFSFGSLHRLRGTGPWARPVCWHLPPNFWRWQITRKSCFYRIRKIQLVQKPKWATPSRMPDSQWELNQYWCPWTTGTWGRLTVPSRHLKPPVPLAVGETEHRQEPGSVNSAVGSGVEEGGRSRWGLFWFWRWNLGAKMYAPQSWGLFPELGAPVRSSYLAPGFNRFVPKEGSSL